MESSKNIEKKSRSEYVSFINKSNVDTKHRIKDEMAIIYSKLDMLSQYAKDAAKDGNERLARNMQRCISDLSEKLVNDIKEINGHIEVGSIIQKIGQLND